MTLYSVGPDFLTHGWWVESIRMWSALGYQRWTNRDWIHQHTCLYIYDLLVIWTSQNSTLSWIFLLRSPMNGALLLMLMLTCFMELCFIPLSASFSFKTFSDVNDKKSWVPHMISAPCRNLSMSNGGLKITKIETKVNFYLFSIILHTHIMFVCLMVFNATFNNISDISWQLVLLVEET